MKSGDDLTTDDQNTMSNGATNGQTQEAQEGKTVKGVVESIVEEVIQSSLEQPAAVLDSEGPDVSMGEPVRKSQRSRTPSVRLVQYVKDEYDDPPTIPSPKKSKTSAATRALPPPPKTPQELYDQVKKSRDKLFFIAYSHSKDPLITEKTNLKTEYQWYLVRIDLATCEQLEETKTCDKTGRYYVEFYTKSSYDRGVLLPGNPLENGIPSSKMKPRPDSDSRYWLEWHEYHFDKKNGDMVVGKAKEFLPNGKKAIHRRLMDLCRRKKQRQRSPPSPDGILNDNSIDGDERLVSEYHPDFDKFTTWADVLDLMDTKTRLVGPFDFDDVKPPPLKEADLAIFNQETRKLFSTYHSDLHVKDRVHRSRWQELMDAIRRGDREIEPPTISKPKVIKRKRQSSAGSKRPREEMSRKGREVRPSKKGAERVDSGNVATEKDPLLFFPASSSKPSLYVRASCRTEKNDRMILSKDEIKEDILNVVDATLARTRHATTNSEYGKEYYVFEEVKEALIQSLGHWMAPSRLGAANASSSVLEQSSEPILEGLAEEGFADEDIESFPVAFAYDHNDPGGISEENAKIAALDYEVEQRRLRAARNSGGGQSKSSKGPSSEEEKKKKNENSTKTGTVAATMPKVSRSGGDSGGQSESLKGPSLVEEKKNQDENSTETTTAEVAAATPQVVRGGVEGQSKSSNGTSLVDENTHSTKAVTAAAAATPKLRSSTSRSKRYLKSSSPVKHPTLNEIYAHIPTRQVDGFPSGWVSHKIARSGSKVARSKDTYYYSPKNQFRFRSKVQVRRFLDTLDKVGGDEMMAIERYQR